MQVGATSRMVHFKWPPPKLYLEAVEAAAIIDLKEGKAASTRLTPRLHPATHPDDLASLCEGATGQAGVMWLMIADQGPSCAR